MKILSAVELNGHIGSHDVATKDGMAYVCNYWNGALCAIDINDLANPSMKGILHLNKGIHDIEISNFR